MWCVWVCVQPILCNNQKKVWKLQGNLHHDTSLFQGRAWLQVRHPKIAPLSRPHTIDLPQTCLWCFFFLGLQIPSGQSWESCKLADPTSLQRFLCCRANKTLEQYETLRAHVFTWHDSGVFTAWYGMTGLSMGPSCSRMGT